MYLLSWHMYLRFKSSYLYIYIDTLQDVRCLLSSAIKVLLHYDQVNFVVSTTLAAINVDNYEIRMDAGKLFANLVNTGLLSKHLVLLGYIIRF